MTIRKPIFERVAAASGKPWDEMRIAVLDDCLDRLGVPRGPVPAQAVAENPDKYEMRDPEAFWTAMRRIFGGSISNDQKMGIDAILAAAAHHPVSWLSYELATAFHETGGKMAPNRENMNYSVAGLRATFGRHRITDQQCRDLGRTKTRPADQKAIANIVYGGEFGRTELGNVHPGDGWKYRGGGMCHNTGLGNAKKADDDMSLGGAYVSNPDIILDIDIAAREMVTGMETGRYSGKNLARYLKNERESHASFMKARPIINGNDRADDVADYADKMQSAVIAGHWS